MHIVKLAIIGKSAAALALAGLWSAADAQVAFPVEFDASAASLTTQERADIASHLQAAGDRWVALLDIDGTRSIELRVALADVATANAASATTVLVGTIGGRATYEQGVAHELRSGTDPNAAAADAVITIGTNYLRNELWFDPDPVARIAPVPANRTDAMSVFLHELGHALAYNGWSDGHGVPPAGYWSTFDRWMQSGTPALFTGPDVLATWGSAPDLTLNNINHWGNASFLHAPEHVPEAQWRNGVPVPRPGCAGIVSADAPPSAGRPPGPHGAPAGLIAELMNGVVYYRGHRYDISPLDVAVLKDAGLPVFVDSQPLFGDGFEGP